MENFAENEMLNADSRFAKLSFFPLFGIRAELFRLLSAPRTAPAQNVLVAHSQLLPFQRC